MGTFNQQVYYYDDTQASFNTFFNNELNFDNIKYIEKPYSVSKTEYLKYQASYNTWPYMLHFSFNSKNVTDLSIYLTWSELQPKQPIYYLNNIKEETSLDVNVVFTPSHICENLLFQFTVPQKGKHIISPTEYQEDCTISNISIHPIKKLLPNNNEKITKLGIQGHPFMYAVINGTPIRVGRNGIYEIEKINIQDLRFAPYAYDSFIVDYVTQSINSDEELQQSVSE